MPRTTLPAAALAAALLAAPPAAAHHVWIEVADFTPAAGSTLPVDLRVGDHLPGDRLPRNASRIVRFAVVGGGDERPIAGVDGVHPSGVARLGAETGERVIVYRGNEARNVLPPERFARYLDEEGLAAITARRAELGESDRPGRERYSRSLKALIAVGGAAPAGDPGRSPHLEAAGLDLELVPETRPAALAAGDRLALRLLWHGEPLAGARVAAVAAAAPDAPLAAVSDAGGRVRFRLGAAGLWRLTAVHMERAEGAAGTEWASVWTALTFVVPERAAAVAGALGGEGRTAVVR